MGPNVLAPIWNLFVKAKLRAGELAIAKKNLVGAIAPPGELSDAAITAGQTPVGQIVRW